jgi:hypothetical protein
VALKVIVYADVELIDSGHGPEADCSEYGNKPWGSIRGEVFPDELSSISFIRRTSA